jgi:hypothetical protein
MHSSEKMTDTHDFYDDDEAEIRDFVDFNDSYEADDKVITIGREALD